MINRSRSLMAIVSALVIGLAASSALATVFDYTIDSAASGVTLSATTAGGLPLKGADLSASLGGSVRADVTNSSIQFVGGTATANNGVGGSFSNCWSWMIGMDAGFSAVSLQVGSNPIPLSNGAFSAGATTVTAGGSMNYNGTGLFGFFIGGGSTPINTPDGGSSNWGTGWLITDNTSERLLVPVQANFSADTACWLGGDWSRVNLTLTGWIVAVRNVDNPSGSNIPGSGSTPVPTPEPTALLLLGLGGLALFTRGRAR